MRVLGYTSGSALPRQPSTRINILNPYKNDLIHLNEKYIRNKKRSRAKATGVAFLLRELIFFRSFKKGFTIVPKFYQELIQIVWIVLGVSSVFM